MQMTLRLMLAFLLAAAARASPYWIEYEPANGNFPEQEGWERIWWYLPAQRWLEDGLFVVNSLASAGTFDLQRMIRPGATDPDPGEVFVMEWGVRIDEVIGYHDIAVGVCSDSGWTVSLLFNETTADSPYDGVTADFTPGALHDFRFVSSSDMRSYTLYIDGGAAFSGNAWLALDTSQVWWGDGVQGGASLARWDYFRFGVVPECTSSVIGAATAAALSVARSRRGR